MNEQPTLGGWDRALIGMNQAADAADQAIPDWSVRALACVLELCQRGGEFTVEDAIELAAKKGIPTPATNRAWGGIIRRAALMGQARNTGRFAYYRNPTNHRRPVAVWEPLR